ncbi:MAG: toxin-antitoxin system HicB family antitoxin [Deltaproteobacteria bacterium]|nr:toxin-antitoxin system HicB family antitoxin [Deltaproteobacteria bacterium]MBI4223898.1 toxin-antitoxin system HicB family antitoxin [Deltaproteobacteria bacterium]
MSFFSGRFVVRLEPSLHERLTSHAAANRLSLNQACVNFLREGLVAPAKTSEPIKAFQKMAGVLRRRFGASLLGVVLFGSRAQGKASSLSDWDLLIVLTEEVPIKRSLYSWWDETIKINSKWGPVNPHFAHLPSEAAAAGGLWLEVALHHQMVYEQNSKLRARLDRIFQMIQKGEIIRRFSNGHPYWVRRKDAQS